VAIMGWGEERSGEGLGGGDVGGGMGCRWEKVARSGARI